MASIRERVNSQGKKSYQVIIRLRGFKPQRATFARKTDAKKWAEATESAMREGRYFKSSESRKHTLADLVERYKRDIIPTKDRYGKNQAAQLDWWKEQLGHELLCDITAPKIAELRDQLLAEKTRRNQLRSPATVNRYLAALSHAFSVAVREWEWVSDNPVAKIRRPKEPAGRTRYLDEEEIKRLMETCRSSDNRFLYPAVLLALSTGMRSAEIMWLRWENIDVARKQQVLHKTKNKERRTIPLAEKVLDALLAIKPFGRNVKGLVFAPRGSEKPASIRNSWEKALKDAHIEDFRFHDLRHTAGSYLAMNNASLLEIAEILGHKTLQMVKRYSHLSDPHTRTVVERMNKKIFEGILGDDDDDPVVKDGGVLFQSVPRVCHGER